MKGGAAAPPQPKQAAPPPSHPLAWSPGGLARQCSQDLSADGAGGFLLRRLEEVLVSPPDTLAAAGSFPFSAIPPPPGLLLSRETPRATVSGGGWGASGNAADRSGGKALPREGSACLPPPRLLPDSLGLPKPVLTGPPRLSHLPQAAEIRGMRVAASKEAAAQRQA